VDVYLARAMILGTIDHVVTRRVLRGKPEDLEALVDPLTAMLMKGLGARIPKQTVNVQICLDSEGGLEANGAGPREKGKKGKRTKNKDQ
jgi:hypothetical protein